MGTYSTKHGGATPATKQVTVSLRKATSNTVEVGAGKAILTKIGTAVTMKMSGFQTGWNTDHLVSDPSNAPIPSAYRPTNSVGGFWAMSDNSNGNGSVYVTVGSDGSVGVYKDATRSDFDPGIVIRDLRSFDFVLSWDTTAFT